MIDIERTLFVCFAYPDMCRPIQHEYWIRSLSKGLKCREDNQLVINKKNIVCARNYAIMRCLQQPVVYQWFVFMDKDVVPIGGTDFKATSAFLSVDADVRCCQVPMRVETSWAASDAFHEPFWCTSRKVLSSIKGPWFQMSYNELHTEMTTCLCQSFRKKVLEAGFSIGSAGYAKHGMNESWC